MGGVQGEDRVAGPHKCGNFFNVHALAGEHADLAQVHHPGALVDQGRNVVDTDVPVAVLYHAHFNALFLQAGPGQDARREFHVDDDHVVASLPIQGIGKVVDTF